MKSDRCLAVLIAYAAICAALGACLKSVSATPTDSGGVVTCEEWGRTHCPQCKGDGGTILFDAGFGR